MKEATRRFRSQNVHQKPNPANGTKKSKKKKKPSLMKMNSIRIRKSISRKPSKKNYPVRTPRKSTSVRRLTRKRCSPKDLTLKKRDYIYLLRHYQKGTDKSLLNLPAKTLKRKALGIIKQKMCRCENKLKRRYRRKGSIAICTKSILKSKGLQARNFTCKKRKQVKLLKSCK